jgi:hypothetical protein
LNATRILVALGHLAHHYNTRNVHFREICEKLGSDGSLILRNDRVANDVIIELHSGQGMRVEPVVATAVQKVTPKRNKRIRYE